MTTAMRDTSADYRTYWIRDGMYYGKARNLGAASCTLPEAQLAKLPEEDRKMLLDEVTGNPSFCEKVAKCMATRSDWIKLVSDSAKEAVVNEFNPSKFKNRKGMWPKLRARAQELAESAIRAIRGKVSSMNLDQKAEAIRGLSRGSVGMRSGLSGLDGLGFFDLLASVIGAAGNVYSQDLIADTKVDIAKIQANSAMNTITAQQSIANAQAAIAAAQVQQAAIQSPVGAAISTITTSTVGGIPVLLIAIPLIGGLIYLFMKK